MIDHTLFDFSKPNIFLVFFIGDKANFLYSNLNGLKHLEKTISKDSLFFNLITPDEVLVKMAYEICFDFSFSSIGFPWNEKTIHINPETQKHKEFSLRYVDWKKQLENFLGKDNIYEISLSKFQINEFLSNCSTLSLSDKKTSLFEFVEYHRLKSNLNYRDDHKVKSKI